MEGVASEGRKASCILLEVCGGLYPLCVLNFSVFPVELR